MIYYYQKILSHRLFAWGTLSVLAGAVLGLLHPALFWKGFGFQSALWGLIDCAIALFALRGLNKKIETPPDFQGFSRDASRLQKFLWVNTGLDVLYVLGGLWMMSSGGDEWWRGMGLGILVQGGFLLLFDALHAIYVPREEIVFPELGILKGDEHQEFILEGGDPVAVLVHGFPGTPAEVREWAMAFNQQGWTVKALLLPGFGADLPNMYQHGLQGWVDKIVQEVSYYKTQGRKVLLAGFSMGGGLSIVAAEKAQPHGLLLLAPFWIPESIGIRLLVGVVRLFLPQAIYPFRLFPQWVDQLKAEARRAAPDVPVDVPSLRKMVQQIQVPLLFLEQFRALSRSVKRSAPRLSMPVCILQGRYDPVVRPEVTTRLARLIKAPLEFHFVSGEHHTLLRGEKGFEETMAFSQAFARKILDDLSSQSQ
jgi:esterase/lipase